MDTKDARVLVVGASGALGGELARRLHENGARVVAAGRDPERTRAVAEDVGTDPLTLDVVDVEACAATVAAAVEQLGGLDLLLVTVGVAAFGKAAELDEAVAEELYAVDVLGPIALVRAAIPTCARATPTAAAAPSRSSPRCWPTCPPRAWPTTPPRRPPWPPGCRCCAARSAAR